MSRAWASSSKYPATTSSTSSSVGRPVSVDSLSSLACKSGLKRTSIALGFCGSLLRGAFHQGLGFVRARQFHDLIEGSQYQCLFGDGPRLGQHLGVLDSRLDLERVCVHPAIAFNDMHRV